MIVFVRRLQAASLSIARQAWRERVSARSVGDTCRGSPKRFVPYGDGCVSSGNLFFKRQAPGACERAWGPQSRGAADAQGVGQTRAQR